MRYVILTLMALPLIAGCTTVPSKVGENYDGLNIPGVRVYTDAEYAAATAERKMCPQVPVTCRMIDHYGVMRDEARAAKGIPVDVHR